MGQQMNKSCTSTKWANRGTVYNTCKIITLGRVSRMTNEMRVRRAKSAKIGKTLTAFLIPGADGDTVTEARQIVVQ